MNLINKYRKGALSGIAAIVTIVSGVLTVPGLIPLTWFPVVAGVVAALGTAAVILSPANTTVEEVASAALNAAVAAAPKVAPGAFLGKAYVNVVPHLDVAAMAALVEHLNANPAAAAALSAPSFPQPQPAVEAPPTPPVTVP